MPATDQTVSGVPGRYASALFELATEEKSVDLTGTQLATFQAAIDESDDLRRLVRSPVFAANDQIAAIDAICERLAIAGTARNFIRLAARNRRLAALSEMIAGYRGLVAAARGEVTASVTSADALSEAQVSDLKAALKASTGRDVSLATRVDASILGGLVVKMGSRMIDSSLKTKLDNLKIAMKGTG
ncbi:MAG: F0F1 ATP synthase subunit delta [Rhizobiales bacterium]|nr:F0F1 ATP synthase subunit delta [Hyphomicrobiales bacterium]MBI3673569.1 F0F1 ATP synthase subunit delta [Hyphomicrobiales bacterium]